MAMTNAENIAKAAQLAGKVKELRAQWDDPMTPKAEKPRLKLQIDTYTWMMERLDPARYGKKIKSDLPINVSDLVKGFLASWLS